MVRLGAVAGPLLAELRNALEREGRSLYLPANIGDKNGTLLAGQERSTVCLCGVLQGMIPMLQNRFDALASESAVSMEPYDTVLNRMHKSIIVKLVTKATEEQKWTRCW